MTTTVAEYTALEYAKMACNTMQKKFTAEKLPPVGHFFYHQGVFLSGVYQTYLRNHDEALFQYIKDYVDAVLADDGKILVHNGRELDDLQAGILLFPLWEKTGDVKYRNAIAQLGQELQDYPRNPDGGFWHREVWARQMWLDGLYMGGPLEVEYGTKFGHPEMVDDAIHQVELMREHCRDERTGLWYHAWDGSEGKKEPWADPITGKSPEFWGRSIGWVPIALLDDMTLIGSDHPGYARLAEILIDLLTSVARYQSAEGRWYQVVDKGDRLDNWLETSCSSLFTAALYRAVAAGILPDRYLDQAHKGYEAVVKGMENNGKYLHVSRVCVGTGLGDYRFYVDRPATTDDLHGQGAFLLMCAVRSDWEATQA